MALSGETSHFFLFNFTIQLCFYLFYSKPEAVIGYTGSMGEIQEVQDLSQAGYIVIPVVLDAEQIKHLKSGSGAFLFLLIVSETFLHLD